MSQRPEILSKIISEDTVLMMHTQTKWKQSVLSGEKTIMEMLSEKQPKKKNPFT